MAAQPPGQFGRTASANNDQIYIPMSGSSDHLPRDFSRCNAQFGGNSCTMERFFALPVPGADPREVIQWKDLYMLLEAATDSAEDVANLVEGIV